ncbi:MAG TPA: GntR family transcriptional regulator, partial [Chloroflexota bacterium]|nr:GntR family transcriptional regulator [Chloroflexota bacterium]
MIGWDAEPVRDRALRHSVRDHVLEAIRDGKLTPGDRVHETSLARALDVSLSPVREALFRLADQGLLEHRPRRGFYVRTLTEAGTREIYTFRALLEGFAARIVTERWHNGVPPEDQT